MKNDKKILSDLSPEDLHNLQKGLEKKIQVLEEQNSKILEGVPNLIPKLKEYSTQADFERPPYVGQHAFDLLSTELKRVIGGKPKALKLTKAERIAKSSIEKTSKEIKEHKQRLSMIEEELKNSRIVDLDQKKGYELPDHLENWEKFPSHTKKNTAIILNVSTRTIYNYVTKKYLAQLPNRRISTDSIERFLTKTA